MYVTMGVSTFYTESPYLWHCECSKFANYAPCVYVCRCECNNCLHWITLVGMSLWVYQPCVLYNFCTNDMCINLGIPTLNVLCMYVTVSASNFQISPDLFVCHCECTYFKNLCWNATVNLSMFHSLKNITLNHMCMYVKSQLFFSYVHQNI